MYFSKLTPIIYIITFCVAGVLLATTLGFDTPFRTEPRLLFFMETLVTLSLGFEVAIQASLMGSSYLHSWANVLDASMAVFSAAFLFWEAPYEVLEYEKFQDMNFSMCLVMLRVVVVFGRVFLIAEQANRARGMKVNSPLDLAKDLDFSVLCERGGMASSQSEDDGL